MQSLKTIWKIFQMAQKSVSDIVMAKGICNIIKCSSAIENSFLENK